MTGLVREGSWLQYLAVWINKFFLCRLSIISVKHGTLIVDSSEQKPGRHKTQMEDVEGNKLILDKMSSALFHIASEQVNSRKLLIKLLTLFELQF